MITNTRLIELRQVANQCQQHADKNEATILENDFLDLYRLFEETKYPLPNPGGITEGRPRSMGPHLGILFGK